MLLRTASNDITSKSKEVWLGAMVFEEIIEKISI